MYQQPVVVVKKGHGCLWALGIVAIAIVGIVVLIAVAAEKTAKEDDANPGGVDRGFGSQDASADVTNPRMLPRDAVGVIYVEVTVTNNSSKRSNYVIETGIESPDGKTRYADGTIVVRNLEPGQSIADKGIGATGNTQVPSDAVVRVKSVSRTAA